MLKESKSSLQELTERLPKAPPKLVALHFFTLTLTSNLNLGVERMILLGTHYNCGEHLYL
jgi:hypothetical protein